MKKILVFGLSSNMGGVETVFDTFYDYFDKKACCFDFVARNGRIAFQKKYEKDGAMIFMVPNFVKRPIGYYLKVKEIMKEYQYDVVYINMLSAANVLPMIAAKSVGINKIVLHAHNNNTTGFMRKILHHLGRLFLHKNCFTRLACSDGAGKYMYGRSKYVVINNPFNYERFKYDSMFRGEIRKKYNVPDKCKMLGMIGRLSHEKNPLFLIDVLKKVSERLDDVKMMFVGDGRLKNAVAEKAKRDGVLNKVVMVSNTEDVYKYYSALDLFVMPSIYEGLGMVGLEAQASGLGCLFSEMIPKEIDMGGNKYLKLDPDIWAQNAVRMLSEYRDRKANRRELFDDRFSASKNTKLLLNAFGEGNHEE